MSGVQGELLSDVLRRVRAAGIRLSAEEDRLRVAGSDRLEACDREILKAQRDEVLKLVRAEAELRHIPHEPEKKPDLSLDQERIWLLWRLAPQLGSFRIVSPIEVEGRVDAALLQEAMTRLVRRHEQLRLDIRATAETFEAGLYPPEAFKLTCVELETDDEERLRKAALRFGETGFGQNEPLFRLGLFSTPERSYVVTVAHHLVSDGWSTVLIGRDLAVFYTDAAEGRSEAKPVASASYFDFARWQRRMLESSVGKIQLNHWQRLVETAPDPLQLPADHPRPVEPSLRAAEREWTLDADLAASVRSAATRTGAGLFALIATAWAIVLCRLGRTDQLIIGLPLAGRTRTETETMVGLFSRMGAMRLDLKPDLRFLDVVQQARDATDYMLTNQDVPVEAATRGLSRDGDLSSLFNVCVNMLPRTRETHVSYAGARGRAIALPMSGTQIFGLSLVMWESADVHLALSYAEERFESETVVRFREQLEDVLRRACADPEIRLADLQAAGTDETAELMRLAKGPAEAGSGLLHELIGARARRTPNAIAVEFGDASLSYGELDRRANGVARRLQALGVGPDRLVAVCLPRGLELICAILGVLKAGGAYLPIDPSYPAERRIFMLNDAGVTAVISSEGFSGVLPTNTSLVTLSAGAAEFAEAGDDPAAPVCAARPENLAYVIYTSGTTGRPKGVLIEHRNIVNHTLWFNAEFGLVPGDRILQRTPSSFDASVWELFSPLAAGATMILAPPDSGADPQEIGRLLANGVTIMQCVPSLLDVLIDAGAFAQASALRLQFCGGEPLNPELAQRFATSCSARLINLYGPTEATIDSLWAEVPPHPVRVPIGRPVGGMSAFIVSETGALLPRGGLGELWMGGAGVGRGYHNQPELTQSRFVTAAFAPGERLYRTGDLVRWRTDGLMEHLGRIDEQVKLHGYRIEPAEIEAQLVAHSSVASAAVVVREDITGHRRLVAYVTPAAGKIDVERLRVRIKSRLPEYMTPSAFVVLDVLPRLPNGKLNRVALPMPERAAIDTAFVAPRTPMENRVAALLCEILGLDRVGVHDNFFELGGDSLLAARFGARLAAVLGRKAPLSKLFSRPTVAELARWLGEEDDGGVASPFPMPLRVGNGVRTAVLFMPTMLGMGSCYGQLARRLRTHADVHTCRLPGVEAGEYPLDDIPAIARHCLDVMPSLDRYDEVALAGWSFGGLIAFEAALQLAQAGSSVRQLILLDTYRPTSKSIADDGTFAARLERQLEAQFGRDGLKAINLPLFAKLHHMNAAAAAAYTPAPYHGSVVEVRAKESANRLLAGALEPLPAPAARTVIAPGGHFSMLAPAGLDALVALFDEALNGFADERL